MDKLQWGNRKRLRCVKVKDKNKSSSSSASINGKSDGAVVVKKKITSRFADNSNNNNNNSNKESQQQQHNASLPHRINNRDLGMSRSNGNENRKASVSLSPEREDRYYTTRGSVGLDDNNKMFMDAKEEEKKKLVWPKLLITLSSKEKEEDFMAMKGCKLPQRPKKRAKLIQKTLLLVSPGTWLSDLCQERYEVREKKTSKKKPRGLKAMGSMESDSE